MKGPHTPHQARPFGEKNSRWWKSYMNRSGLVQLQQGRFTNIVGFFMLREAYADSLRRFVEGPRGIQEPTLKEMSSMLMASAPTSDRSRQ